MFLPPSTPPTSSATDGDDKETPGPFLRQSLANGLQLSFYDQSNRYFGDYHRVRIVVETTVLLDAGMIPDPQLLEEGRRRFGESFTTSKTLERMGVAGDRVEALKDELVESSLSEFQRYLSRPEIPVKLLQNELTLKPSPSTVLRRQP